jgi:A/G-specific adenine glycosylase
MLQQTTVATVRPRFERFVCRWPTLEALVAAKEEDILSEWAGLGYYARARNLIACAHAVARLGGFPRSAAALRQLPGIGAYTSAAIAAIAFGEKAVAVDTNVERVIARLHAIRRPSRAQVEQFVLAMMPTARPGDFVQAMMDLGATICRPRNPRCGECPLAYACAAFATGSPESIPERRQRAERPHRHGVADWIERQDAIWLVRRPGKGLLGGMPALPGSEWSDLVPDRHGAIATVHHVFSHFSLDLHLVPRSEPDGPGWWQPLAGLDDAGLPTLYRKAIKAALGADRRLAA